MSISPIQNPLKTGVSARVLPARRPPQGLSSVPDRIEENRLPPEDETHPSLFKEYLFSPFIQAIKWVARGIFNFFDFLRRCAFDVEDAATPADRQRSFLKELRSAPSPEQIFREFEMAYSVDEQNRLYRSIGETHVARISWKEAIWERTAQENIDLGRRLVQRNPFLLRDVVRRG